jgi:spermidine synthase
MLDDVHVRHLEALRSLDAAVTSQGLELGSQYVMFFAEAELMRLHARHLVDGVAQPDVLEVGIGLGVFAEQLASVGVGSYTAVEAHPDVADIARTRVLSAYPAPTDLVVQPWQLTAFPPESFDAIMYDTWPPDGCADSDFAVFVETVAMRCLRPGGRLSFFSSGSTLSDTRRQVMERHFAEVKTWSYSLAPEDVPPSWTKPTADFVIPIATKASRR